MATADESKVMYKAINKKMGETVFLTSEKLHHSEYNTRSTCIDVKHVEYLASRIVDQGFHPKRALSVNVITGAGGTETDYRVAAGVHRFEAAKRANLENIPCVLYRGLTEDEECFLDKWDNEMDETHRNIHFLDEAEHYRYLQDEKKWSVRRIAQNKNTNKNLVQRRLQIAFIPEEAKKIIKSVPPGVHFYEKYFRDICRLSDPHIITVCKEIATRAEQAEKGEKDQMGMPVRPMKQADIEKRVKELLRIENQGGREVRVREHIRQLSLLHLEGEDDTEKEYCTERTIIVPAEKTEETQRRIEPDVAPSEPLPEVPSEAMHRYDEKISRKLNMNRCVRWIKFAGLIKDMGSTNYILLRDIIEFDLWYRANEDMPFYLGEEAGGDPFALLAGLAGVEKEHIQKRSLPYLKKEGFLDYWAENGVYWFKLNWNKFAEIYLKRAYGIHYKHDGLKDLPADYSGFIRPTPFHYVRIENGKTAPWNGDAPEGRKPETENKKNTTSAKNTAHNDPLAEKLRALTPPVNDEKIAELCSEKREETAIALKLLEDKTDEKRKSIGSESAYVLGIVEKGPQLPKGFVTPEEARSREERKNTLSAFITTFKEKNYKKFCPNDNSCYAIIDRDDCGFTYEKEEGEYGYAFFKDWMEEKFFR